VAASKSRVEVLKFEVLSVGFQDLDRQTDKVYLFIYLFIFCPKLLSSMVPHYMVFETWDLNFEAWEILGYGFQDMVFRTWDLNFGAWIFTLAVSKTET
jgi:hypothetical protein